MKSFFGLLTIALLFSSLSWANQYHFEVPGSTFSMKIDQRLIHFESELIQKKIASRDCNRRLISQLNAEVLFQLPDEGVKEGLKLTVDGNEFRIDSRSKSAIYFMNMETRILAFLIQEGKACD